MLTSRAHRDTRWSARSWSCSRKWCASRPHRISLPRQLGGPGAGAGSAEGRGTPQPQTGRGGGSGRQLRSRLQHYRGRAAFRSLFVANSTTFMRDRTRIINVVAKHRLPAIYEWAEQVEDGGLMSYGSSSTWISRRVAAYVDRIFKGAKPSDLPIEQPTKFEFVINATTAKALGLTIPPSLLLRADQVIEE